MKADMIKKYMTGINFKTEDWSIHKITDDLKKFLGETPSVDVTWQKDVMLNESGEAKEFKKIDKISVIFTDIDEKIKKLDFRL